jgi:Endoplasmic reticulum vesicle transporter
VSQVEEHPGCLMAGFLLVNRVPGNFHIEARSNYHNLNPVMANLSHMVNSLSFGPVINQKMKNMLTSIPEEFFSIKSISPIDGRMYVNKNLHTAYHHYLKVVSTHFGSGYMYVSSGMTALAYQMVESAQVMNYDTEEIPEARFAYDLSPMAVVITKKGKRWYEFITSVCALIGGTFTVVGLLSSFLGVVFKGGKKM